MATAQQAKEVTLSPEVVDLIKHITSQQLLNMRAFAEELKKPYIDPKAVEREERERKASREAYRMGQKIIKATQDRCSHRYKGGAIAISLMHNFLDRQTRGVCNKCRLFLEPKHIEVGFDQVPRWIEEHPKYHLVREVEQELAAV